MMEPSMRVSLRKLPDGPKGTVVGVVASLSGEGVSLLVRWDDGFGGSSLSYPADKLTPAKY